MESLDDLKELEPYYLVFKRRYDNPLEFGNVVLVQLPYWPSEEFKESIHNEYDLRKHFGHAAKIIKIYGVEI